MDALVLLGRALEHTCAALTAVSDDHLHRPTPCRGWDLADLLDHMDDGLDAFAEGAAGSVALSPGRTARARVTRLQVKAGALHRAWTRVAEDRVLVGGVPLQAGVLVAAAALEIAVHGWDVDVATGRRRPLPADLATGLLAVAHHLVDAEDRVRRFGPELAPSDTTAGARLLAFLGRPTSYHPVRAPA